MIIDHIGLTVPDLAAATAFFQVALAPLDIQLLAEFPGFAGFGKEGTHKAEFWIQAASPDKPATSPIHVAFEATTRAEVDAFHAAALAAGALDNGAPGLREIYHPNYYGGFVTGPGKHNIEAVCHSA